MSEKIKKLKPDKIKKRVVRSLQERQGYAQMIKNEGADYDKKVKSNEMETKFQIPNA